MEHYLRKPLLYPAELRDRVRRSFSTGARPAHALAESVQKLGLKMVHVPFTGAGPATQAALAGQLDMYSANIGSVLGQIQSGALRAIVQTGEERGPNCRTSRG